MEEGWCACQNTAAPSVSRPSLCPGPTAQTSLLKTAKLQQSSCAPGTCLEGGTIPRNLRKQPFVIPAEPRSMLQNVGREGSSMRALLSWPGAELAPTLCLASRRAPARPPSHADPCASPRALPRSRRSPPIPGYLGRLWGILRPLHATLPTLLG